MLKRLLVIAGVGLLLPWLILGILHVVHIDNSTGLLPVAAMFSATFGIGILLGGVPLLLGGEIYFQLRGKRPLPHPYLTGALASLGIGAIEIVWLVRRFTQGSGEGGLLLVLVAPIALGGCLAAGLLLGRLYQGRGCSPMSQQGGIHAPTPRRGLAGTR
jgi:hypothetical protein